MGQLKWFATYILLTCCTSISFSQTTSEWGAERISWVPLSGSFLEPNQFSTIWDFKRESLILEAGYGQDVIKTGKISTGIEGLIWSGLKSTSGFRFPVETADFFFGLYAVYSLPIDSWKFPLPIRLRLSHISSHAVDGLSTITFDTSNHNASSHYSREFISIESEIVPHTESSWFAASAGIKYIFHQVTKVEPAIQFPVSIDLIPRFLPSTTYFFLTASTIGSAYYPQYSGALTIRFNTGKDTFLDLFGEYHSGATRFGIEGNQKENGYEFGIKLSRIPFLVESVQ